MRWNSWYATLLGSPTPCGSRVAPEEAAKFDEVTEAAQWKISESRREASRNNGRASRGPKTAQGKARASKNAWRHGLSIPITADPKHARDIELLAQEIAGANPHTDILKRARAVAEAQIELARIRAARHQVAQDDEFNAHRKFAQLIALDRYERRAMSRRKFAVRMFNGLPRCKRAINNQANR